MKEHELNALVGVVSDPINCVYDISSAKNIAEIQRIIQVFNINKTQKNKHKVLALKNLVTLKLVMSNN